MGSSGIIALLRGSILSAEKGYHHLLAPTSLVRLTGHLFAQIPSARRRASFGLGEMVLPFHDRGKLLEIGCGNGSYLSLMKMLGWSTWGIEPDPTAATIASRSAGCEVYAGTIEDAPFEPGSFHAVASNHVLEHVRDPKSFVAGAARLLSSGGRMVVRTPNFQSLGHRVFGTDWFSLDPPRHLYLFTPASLRSLFEESGMFRELTTKTVVDGSRLAVQRRYAVRQTGSFLGQALPTCRSRAAEMLFRVVEATGNRVLLWGEDIECSAVRI